MFSFKKKTKVNLDEFCTEYYDKHFLETIIAGIDMSDSYNELISEKITEVDSGFKEVDFRKFGNEILILKFELFALAWFHQFGDKSGVLNSTFTKEYLQNKNREDIWNDSEYYNQAIAKSSTHGSDPKTMSGRARISFINSMRVELFKNYTSKGIGGTCVARVLNRYGTESSWKRLSITLSYLGATLCERLNCELNEKARFILIATLKGLYDGSKQNLEDIKIIS